MEAMTSGVLCSRLLKPSRNGFLHDWLRAHAEEAVSLVSTGMSEVVRVRVAAAARAASQGTLRGGRTSVRFEDRPVPEVDATEHDLTSRFSAGDSGLLLALPDLTGAVLITARGYSIAAGPHTFVEECCGGPIGEAKRGFAAHAIEHARREPDLMAIATEYGCSATGRHFMPAWNAWRQPSDVPADSHVHAQLDLMQELVSGEVTAPEFDDRWWELRSAAIDAGRGVEVAPTSIQEESDDGFLYRAARSLADPGGAERARPHRRGGTRHT